MTLQQQIIQALGAKPQIDVEGEIRRSVDFLKSYLQTYPFIKSLVLGISGGQDSTLTGKLCQMAIDELRAESGDRSLQFIAVRLPYGVQADEQDCQDAIEFILAGASAVSVGAMNFVDPYTTVKVVEGIEDYMRTYHVENLTDLIGAVQ